MPFYIYNLSLLDRFAPLVYLPMLLHYLNPNPIQEMGDGKRWQLLLLLKQSVSKTLTHFYPLAGRIKGHFSIDCNDQGGYYVEAHTDSRLNHFFNSPNLSLISKFLNFFHLQEHGMLPLQVLWYKVTVFACGGLAIAATVSHMLLDGASLSVFLKAWEAMARRDHHHQTQPESKYNNYDPIIEELDTERHLTSKWVNIVGLFRCRACWSHNNNNSADISISIVSIEHATTQLKHKFGLVSE